MPDRAALVTGASSGIGLAIARVPGEEGYGLIAARRPELRTSAHRVVPEIVVQRPGEAR